MTGSFANHVSPSGRASPDQKSAPGVSTEALCRAAILDARRGTRTQCCRELVCLRSKGKQSRVGRWAESVPRQTDSAGDREPGTDRPGYEWSEPLDSYGFPYLQRDFDPQTILPKSRNSWIEK